MTNYCMCELNSSFKIFYDVYRWKKNFILKLQNILHSAHWQFWAAMLAANDGGERM